jgi:hypothetical protein
MSADIVALMRRNLLEIFNEREPDKRTAVMAEVYTSSVRFYEPDQTHEGRAAVGVRVGELLGEAPGFVFAPDGDGAVNQDHGYLRWTMGPEGGPPVVEGTDVASVVDGRIDTLRTFLTRVPPPG